MSLADTVALRRWKTWPLALLLSIFCGTIIDIEDNPVLSGSDWGKKSDIGRNIYRNYWHMSIIVVYIQIKHSIHTFRRDSIRPFVCSLSLLEADSAFIYTIAARFGLNYDVTYRSFSFLLSLGCAMVFVLWYPTIVYKPTKCELLPKRAI
jgi:hypothetical protein